MVIEPMANDESPCICSFIYWVSVVTFLGKITSGAQLVMRFPSPSSGWSARESRRSYRLAH